MNERAAQYLLQSQNADGGWGYRIRGMSYIEPTAAAILALEDLSAQARAHDFLRGLQQKDGGWGIAAMDTESGWMTAWAVLALANFPEAGEAVSRGVAWLLAEESYRIDDPVARAETLKVFRIDSTLRGWAWQSGDAAWVHPTSLAIRALVAAGKRDEPRVREGIAYLFDRAVESGGWNIGNPWMIDKKIPATIQDTAVALMALRAVNASNDARIEAAIQYLRDAVANAQTPAELAWGIYALRDWKLEVGRLIERLNGLQNADGSWGGNPFITAIAMQATS